jgi:hypothetical protein
MSLLWKTATARPGLSLTAAWAPYDGEEDIHPSELESAHLGPSHELDEHGGREHVQRLADSIRTHGYKPEVHGQLGLNITDHGENIYNHSSGSNPHPQLGHLHHEHLLQALQQSGHGPVRVHVHDQRSDEGGEDAPRYFHGSTHPDLEEIRPNHGTSGNFGHFTHEPGYAYATGEDTARHYADRAAGAYGGRSHVYEVTPRGPVEKDPQRDAHGNLRGNFEDDVRSRHGFQVLGEQESGHDDEDEDY